MKVFVACLARLDEKELDDSVVKFFFTTAADGRRYKVIYYAFQLFFRLFLVITPHMTISAIVAIKAASLRL